MLVHRPHLVVHAFSRNLFCSLESHKWTILIFFSACALNFNFGCAVVRAFFAFWTSLVASSSCDLRVTV